MSTLRPFSLLLIAAISFLFLAAGPIRAQSANTPPTAEGYYRTGVAAARVQGRQEEAMAAFRDAIRLDPKHEGAQSMLARILMRLQKFEEARSSLQAAVKVLPDSARLHRQLAEAELACGNESAALDELKEAHRLEPNAPGDDFVVTGPDADPGRLNEAITATLRALQRDADNTRLQFQLGMFYALGNSWDQSIAAFARVLALAPNYPGIHQTLAAIYDAAGRPTDAIAELNVAIRMDPNDFSSYFLLGKSLRELGDRDGALAAFLRSNEIKALPSTALSIGELLELKGDHEHAVPFLRLAVQGMPHERGAYSSLARALINLGRFDDATPFLQRLVQMQPADADALADLGNNYMSGGHLDEAVTALTEAARLKPNSPQIQEVLRVASVRKTVSADLPQFQKAVAADPKNPVARVQLARRLSALRRFDEAESEFLAAMLLVPNNWELENALAVTYAEAAQPAKAVVYYQRAATHHPHEVIFYSLGGAYEQLGQVDDAIAAYRKSTELKPDFTMPLYRLGILYDDLGRWPESIEVLRKVLQIEPTDVFALHALGKVYYLSGDKTAARQQYNILRNLDANKAADLLRIISR